MLTSRLGNLVEHGLVRRVMLPPPFGAHVYELTPIGLELKAVIHGLIRWGGHFLFPMRADDEFEPDWVLLALDAIARQSRSPARKVVVRVRHKSKVGSFLVEGGAQGTTICKSDGPGGAIIEAGFDTLLRIISGDISVNEAASKRLASVEGSLEIARSLPKLFDMRRG